MPAVPVGLPPPNLDDLLTLVRERRGVDFRHYRRPTVERRVRGRMHLARAASYADYHARLTDDPAEVDHLLAYLTIKVSRFFRNPAVFETLRQVVVPSLWHPGCARPPRIWSAGCGNGEEAYSLALLFQEAEPAPNQPPIPLVIATDIDEKALAAARAGVYPAEALVELPAATVAAHFIPQPSPGGVRYTIGASARAGVQFHRHDLAAAAPAPAGPTFDLICCRNVLIYFDAPLRDRVQQLLYRSLSPGGYLCLGEAEWLSPALRPALEVIDRRGRVFRRRFDGAGELAW